MVATVAAGCTATSTANTVSATSTRKAATASTATPRKTAPKRDLRAGVGDTLTLKDNTGHQFAITLVKVDNNPEATDEFNKPNAGMRYWAAQFRIKAIGGDYADSPSNGAHAVDSKGQSYSTDLISTISSGQMFEAQTRITKGSSGLGWLAFQVQKKAKITKVQFGLDSGFSATGEWLARVVKHQ